MPASRRSRSPIRWCARARSMSSSSIRSQRWCPAPSSKQVEFDIMYGEGIAEACELIDLGVKAGVVEKSGSWSSFDSQRIGQGRENAKLFLKANPDIAAKIETAVRQNAGLIAERILAGEDGGENEDAAE